MPAAGAIEQKDRAEDVTGRHDADPGDERIVDEHRHRGGQGQGAPCVQHGPERSQRPELIGPDRVE